VWVQFGNDHAVEAYRETSGDSEESELKHRSVQGRQITALVMPDDWSLSESFVTTLEVASHHFDTDPETDDKHPPAWIESSSEGLTALLVEHFGLKNNKRPRGWDGNHPSIEALKGTEDAR
jgi:hypothetical protein